MTDALGGLFRARLQDSGEGEGHHGRRDPVPVGTLGAPPPPVRSGVAGTETSAPPRPPPTAPPVTHTSVGVDAPPEEGQVGPPPPTLRDGGRVGGVLSGPEGVARVLEGEGRVRCPLSFIYGPRLDGRAVRRTSGWSRVRPGPDTLGRDVGPPEGRGAETSGTSRIP